MARKRSLKEARQSDQARYDAEVRIRLQRPLAREIREKLEARLKAWQKLGSLETQLRNHYAPGARRADEIDAFLLEMRPEGLAFAVGLKPHGSPEVT